MDLTGNFNKTDMEHTDIFFSQRSTSPVLPRSVWSAYNVPERRSSPFELSDLSNSGVHIIEPAPFRRFPTRRRNRSSAHNNFDPSIQNLGNNITPISFPNQSNRVPPAPGSSNHVSPPCPFIGQLIENEIETLYQRSLHFPRTNVRSTTAPNRESNYIGPYIPRSHRRHNASTLTRYIYPAYMVHHNNLYPRRHVMPALVITGDGRIRPIETSTLLSQENELGFSVDRFDNLIPSGSNPPWLYNSNSHVNNSAGLSNAAISSIPKCKKDDDCCPICLDVSQDKSAKQLPICGHQFHASCLDRWLSVKNNCPVCRKIAVQN